MTLRILFPHCPVCAGPLGKLIGRFDCSGYPHYGEPLPRVLTWLQCARCGHTHTDGYWSPEGLAILLARAHGSQLAGSNVDQKRILWAPAVQSVQARLPCEASPFEVQFSWLDVGCGDGALVMTAAEYGFDAVGLDSRRETVEKVRALGYKAIEGDFLDLASEHRYDVLSLADVLEHLPYPPLVLEKARAMLKPQGLLFISCPNLDSASWRAMDASRSNPYWIEMEHCHNFSRRLLMALLQRCGFRPLHYAVNQRYRAGMDIVSVKAAT